MMETFRQLSCVKRVSMTEILGLYDTRTFHLNAWFVFTGHHDSSLTELVS